MPRAETWTLRKNEKETELWSKVAYCLPANGPKFMEASCALRLSPAIMIIVTGLNLFKCVCIAYTAYLHSRATRASESRSRKTPLYLVTIGDAMHSFLQSEDIHTRDLNCATKLDFTGTWPTTRPHTLLSKSKSAHWFQAASRARWCITMSL